MTDNRLPYFGWTPTPKKICIRCHELVECILYALCDKCREHDRQEAQHYQDYLDGKEMDPRD